MRLLIQAALLLCSLSFLQNLNQLRVLSLYETQVNGSVTDLPQLTKLEEFEVSQSSLIDFPGSEGVAGFIRQHPNRCLDFLCDY